MTWVPLWSPVSSLAWSVWSCSTSRRTTCTGPCSACRRRPQCLWTRWTASRALWPTLTAATGTPSCRPSSPSSCLIKPSLTCMSRWGPRFTVASVHWVHVFFYSLEVVVVWSYIWLQTCPLFYLWQRWCWSWSSWESWAPPAPSSGRQTPWLCWSRRSRRDTSTWRTCWLAPTSILGRCVWCKLRPSNANQSSNTMTCSNIGTNYFGNTLLPNLEKKNRSVYHIITWKCITK